MYDVFYRAMLDYPDLAIAAHGMMQSRKPGAATLLEVACGTGLFLEEFSKWYEVAGLDSSAEMLAVARDRVPDAVLQQADMATFDLGQTFDAVICMFSSIGYVVTIERLESALRRFAAHLNPGGVMIVEPWLSPDAWRDGHIAAESVADGDLAVARTSTSVRDGRQVRHALGFLRGSARRWHRDLYRRASDWPVHTRRVLSRVAGCGDRVRLRPGGPTRSRPIHRCETDAGLIELSRVSKRAASEKRSTRASLRTCAAAGRRRGRARSIPR